MRYITIIGIIVLLITGLSAYSKEAYNAKDEERFEKVNKLVKVAWSNTGSWIFFYDPSMDRYEDSVILEISFHREYEDMGRGGKNAYIVEEFIQMVNDKFDKKVKLVQFRNDGKNLELVYGTGIWIIWDYANKKEPIEVKKG